MVTRRVAPLSGHQREAPVTGGPVQRVPRHAEDLARLERRSAPRDRGGWFQHGASASTCGEQSVGLPCTTRAWWASGVMKTVSTKSTRGRPLRQVNRSASSSFEAPARQGVRD